MNTNMNQYLIFWCASNVVRKMTAYQLCCAGLARSPFVLTEHISSIYIYVVHARHFSSAGPVLHNVGGVKCQPYLKHGNHWKPTLKMF